jgi:ParB/RepB/Spo0J family partition protein
MRSAARQALTLRAAPPRSPELAQRGDLLWIEAQYLQPDPLQPRKQFDDDTLGELAASLSDVGVLTPLRVRPADETGRHTITDGERRWRAGQQAGIVEFPCLVEAADQDTAFFEAYLANLHRDALAPVDAAIGLQHIRETFSLVGDDEVAAKLNKSVGWVRQMNAVLGLDPDARQTLQARGEPVAVAVGLRPQSREERKATLDAIADLPNRDAKVAFIGRVNDQVRAGLPIHDAIANVRGAQSPADDEAQQSPAPRRRSPVGRPTRFTLPFTWRGIDPGIHLLEISPSALATTRLAGMRTASFEEWLQAVRADLIAFRDSCADVADSGPAWNEMVNALTTVLGLTNGLGAADGRVVEPTPPVALRDGVAVPEGRC